MYKIAESRFEELQAVIDKFNRKASKLGLEPLKMEVVGSEFIEIAKYPGTEYITDTVTIKINHVEIFGNIPVIAGYQFVGTIDHSEFGNIIRNVSGVDIPDYYRTAPVKCDHCQTHRYRKNSFIVQEVATGEYKQVGRNCLADYLRSANVDNYVWHLTSLLKISDSCESDGEYGGYCGANKTYNGLEKYLACVSRAVELFGWMSASTAKETGACSTAGDASWLYHPPDRYAKTSDICKWEQSQPVAANFDESREIIKHIRETVTVKENKTEFEANMATLYANDYFDPKYAGYIAAGYVVRQKYLEAEIKRQAQPEINEEYVGTVGERLVVSLTVLATRDIEGQYGITTMHRMADKEGHIFTWFASNASFDVGANVTLKATIKDHAEYQGHRQTVITRCKAV